MPSQTSSLRAYGLRAHSGTTACSVAAVLAACAASPSLALADHTGSHDAVLAAKKDDAEKPGRGIGRGRDKVPVPAAPVPAPTVAAPTPPPAPAPTQPPAPAPTQEAPRQQAPKPRPEPPRAAPEAARPTPEVPRPTPQAPVVTPDRQPSPDPTPTRDPDDDRAGIGAAPGSSGSAPGAATPEAPRAATPGAAVPAPARRRVQAPPPTGGLIDFAGRAGDGASAPARSRGPRRTGGSTGSTPVAYRQDSTGRRVYSVPSADGTRRREVAVPGGVFGILPSAAIEATAEVAGARAEGRTSRSTRTGGAAPAPTGVTATLSRPLNAIDEVTGGAISPLLVVGALAAMAVALGFGIRRELHRW